MTQAIQQFLQNIEKFFEPFLKNLDPSLFQSVIIGLLMILIFVGEQIFSEVKSQKGRGEFSKMVIFYEILNIVFIPIFATIALIFFAFFKDDLNGHSINSDIKILTLFSLLIFVFVFLQPIFKFQRFFRGKRHKLEISFLKHLSFSKILKFRNTAKAEKMVRAWNSFWSEKSEFNEREFTKIFISHIDDAIKYRELELAIELSQTYVNNIEKRDRFSIGYEILPKVFKWNEMFWGGERLWLKSYDTEKRIQNFILQKYFPTFRTWVLNIYKKTNSKRDNFWNWHYFGGEFFQVIIKVLLKDGHGLYQFFSSFKKHIEESEKKLDKIEDEKEKEKYWNYVTELFASFCQTFFNKIDSAPSNSGIWKHNFPAEWKILIANKNNRISRVVLHEFLQWSRDQIFKKDDKDNFNKDLTKIINGIFPNVHSSLFTAFLMLFCSSDIKYAIEKEPNFYITGVSVSWSGSVEEDGGDRDKRLAKMMQEKEISQKEETIQIILNFFHFWQTLTLYKDNLSNDESKKWESFTEVERKLIVRRVRKEKLEKIKAEIESAEIKKICDDSERKELYRKDFLELVELLLLEIEK